MNIREEQLQKCCDEKDERIAQLEEIVSQLSDEVDTMHRTRVHLEQLNMEVHFYSCNMGTSDLPDMYSQSPRAAGMHIKQITSAYVTANM